MREIKFRGKRVDNGEWVYGSLDNSDSRECYILYRTESYQPYSIRVNSETVGQFTGLLDKNGKEIFEGDIVESGEVIYRGKKEGKNKGVIVFHNGSWKIKYIKLSFGVARVVGFYTMAKRHTIIGNIHENHELLNH